MGRELDLALAHLEQHVASLWRRYEEGLAQYKEYHPGHIITPLEDLAEEGPDWAQYVSLHKTRYEEALAALEQLRASAQDDAAKLDDALSAASDSRLGARLSSVIEAITELTPTLVAHLKGHTDDLRRLHPDAFEHLSGLYLRETGFDEVRLVGRDSRTSADILAIRRTGHDDLDFRVFVEVKRRSDSLSVNSVDAVLGAFEGERPMHGWHAAIILALQGFATFRKYSPDQLRLRGLTLRTGRDLERWLLGYTPTETGLWLPKKMP